MATALMQEEYFAIRYLYLQLWRKKSQNLTLKKCHFKTFNGIFWPKNVHGYHDNDTIKLQWKRTFSTCI